MDRPRPGHPDSLVLQAYADGQLPPAEARSLEQHLLGCSRCRADLAALQDLISEIRALPDAPLERDLARRVEAALRKRRRLGAFSWLTAAELTAGLAIAVWAWPQAERSIQWIVPGLRAVGPSFVNGVLALWRNLTIALRDSIMGLNLEIPGLLPGVEIDRLAVLVAAVAAVCIVSNVLLLRRGAAPGAGR